jgi:hypothetical protein
MNKFVNNKIFSIAACLLLVLLLTGPLTAQDKSDDALKKKYAPILGEYEFDLSNLGGDVQVLTFQITDGALWVDSGDGDPAVCEPVEGAEFEFTAESSDGQALEVRFGKDDAGNISTCSINIVAMSIEIEGIKIK